MRPLDSLSTDERDELDRAIGRVLREHHDWEPWERTELIHATARALGVQLLTEGNADGTKTP